MDSHQEAVAAALLLALNTAAIVGTVAGAGLTLVALCGDSSLASLEQALQMLFVSGLVARLTWVDEGGPGPSGGCRPCKP